VAAAGFETLHAFFEILIAGLGHDTGEIIDSIVQRRKLEGAQQRRKRQA
jgi:hypothetical protein